MSLNLNEIILPHTLSRASKPVILQLMYIHSPALQKATSKRAIISLLDALQLYSHNMNVNCRRQSNLKLKLMNDTSTARSVPYLLTPWSRVILEKLTDSQLVTKFPTFYGTRRFITAFTIARHLSLSNSLFLPHRKTHQIYIIKIERLYSLRK